MSDDALDRAIKAAGGVTALARTLGIAPQAISQWGKVPVMRVVAVGNATNMQPHELRPDVFPAPDVAA